jgi:hypothetical protein
LGYYDPIRSVYVSTARKASPVTEAVAVASASGAHGFAWADASIGGAVGAGIILLLLAATRLTVRQHRRIA